MRSKKPLPEAVLPRRFILISALAFTLLFGASQLIARQYEVPVGGDYSLIDHAGATVTPADFHGKYVLVYFGFTNCEFVCPVAIGTMHETLQLLGPGAEEVATVFITTDPARDTPQALRAWRAGLGDELTTLTGTREQVDAALDVFQAYAAAVRLGDDAYTVNHSSLIYVLNRDGVYLRHFGHNADPKDISAYLSSHIERKERHSWKTAVY